MILGKIQPVNITPPQVDLLDSLISVYELNESSGSIAYDSHGSNDMAVTGALMNQSGKLGTSYSFDTLNLGDKCSVNDPFSISDDLTIACWVNMASLTKTKNNRHCFFGKGSEWANGYLNQVEYFLSFYSEGGKFRFTVGNEYSLSAVYSRANIWSANTWYHVIGIYNKASDWIYLYVDNYLEADAPHGANNGWGIPNLSYPLQIGASSVITNEGKYYMDGKIDQCAIWSRCLNSAERAALYNSGNGLSYSNW